MKNILFVYNEIQHYRHEFFVEMSKYYNVTVLHSGEYKECSNKYKQIVANKFKFWRFQIQSRVISEGLNKKYDAVIYLFDVAWLMTILSFFLKIKGQKKILWGAWRTNSGLANKVRLLLSKLADANVFYSNEALKDFVNLGLTSSKAYVANNTFKVDNVRSCSEHNEKFRVLFVGSLNSRKENIALIDAFSNILSKVPNDVILTFVGDGEEYSKLVGYVSDKQLEERVEFAGRVQDNEELYTYFQEALVSVSVGQAGLSVLHSFGFGVPYITRHNAVSGGEKSNIKNDINGYTFSSQEELESLLTDTCNDINKAKELGANAFKYYGEFCSIDNMAKGFIDAIENTRTARVDERAN